MMFLSLSDVMKFRFTRTSQCLGNHISPLGSFSPWKLGEGEAIFCRFSTAVVVELHVVQKQQSTTSVVLHHCIPGFSMFYTPCRCLCFPFVIQNISGQLFAMQGQVHTVDHNRIELPSIASRSTTSRFFHCQL